MQILDTNVLSVLMQDEPDSKVTNWLDLQPASSIWTTSVTVYEIRYGLELLPKSKKRREMEVIFDDILEEDLEGRILSLDTEAAQHAATLGARRRKIGRTIDVRDTLIAGIALARRATLVTRNTKHFDDLDIDVINPWKN